ncbi:MAG: helix-turn-helix domain-containing protein [Flavobacteriales bacterium]
MIAQQFADKSILNKLINIESEKDVSHIVWPNIVMNCSETSFQKKIDETSLTIITNRQGRALCEVDGNAYKVCSSAFLIINPFQHLKYTIDTKEVTETTNIHFNHTFAQSLYQYFTESDTHLLENMEEKKHDALPIFFNELYYKNSNISGLIEQLLLCVEKDCFDEKLTEIGVQLLLNHREFLKKIKLLKSRKSSTKKELYKRISKAKDMIFDSYKQPLSIEELSKEACISKYHFTRLFKDIYGVSPYQFLKTVRLEKAKELLLQNSPIHEVAHKVGFAESNSFINAFKTYTNIYPSEFRNEISKNE